MTTVALVALLALGAAVVVALMAPVDVHVALSAGGPAADAALRVEVDARWLGMRRHMDLLPRAAAAPGAFRAEAPHQPPEPAPKRRARRPSVVAVLRAPGLAAALRRLVADLAHVLGPEHARGLVRFGLDDPAATGEVYGWVQAMLWPAHGLCGGLSVVPVFDTTALVAEADLRWHGRPASVVRPLARFGLSPAFWRALRAARRGRRTA